MAERERWLEAIWPFVRGRFPDAPTRVVEIGCGSLGGFVPRLERAGYQAIGIDPEAPPGPSYRQADFEDSDIPGPVDAIVASLSLHHVADLGEVLDLIQTASAADEQAAIDADLIQANRILYAGRRGDR